MKSENNISAFEIQYIEDELITTKGLKRRVFFDAYDIISMIQGVWHFNKDYHFAFEKFKNQKNCGIHGIAAKGWLGSISMLKPHQDEFIYKFTNNDIDFPKNITFSQSDIESEFLFNLGIKKPQIFRDLSNSRFIEYVDELKMNSLLLFKSNSILCPYHWVNRYKKFFETDKIINLSFEQISHDELMKTDIFKLASSKLDNCRPKQSFSNYMDALSIAQLQDLCNHFKHSDFKEPLPIFYTGSDILQNVLKEIHEENFTLLSYPHPYIVDKYIPIYRYEQFFFIDPIFNLKDNQIVYEAIDDLHKLKNNLKILIKTNYNSFNIVSDKEISDFIGQDVEIEFFSKIWLKKGYEEFRESILKYLEYYDFYDEKVEKIVILEKEKIKKRFEKEIEYNSLLYQVITQLSNIREETKKINKIYDRIINPFTDFGLTRFSFTKNICKSINELVYTLFKNVSNENRIAEEDLDNSITKLIDYLIRGSSENNQIEELNIGLAILWIYGKYDLIEKLSSYFLRNKCKLDIFSDSELNSFYTLYASGAVYSNNVNIDSINIILDHHNNLATKDFRFKLSHSFILFQLWNYYTRKITIPELANESQKNAIRQNINIHSKVISLLEEAILSLEQTEFWKNQYLRRKYYYIVNNYIYYCSKGCSWKKFVSNKLEGYYVEIRDNKNDSNVWQNRFFDTLGWYDFRKAVIAYKKGDLQNTIHFLYLAKKNNSDSFIGPLPKREEANYQQLKVSLEKFECEIANKISAYNIAIKS